MKKILFILTITAFTVNAFSQNIVVDGKSYAVDTLHSIHPAGPGVKKYSYRLPEFVNGFGTLGKGLIVNVVEVDLSSPHASVEVCAAHPANLYSEETVGNMVRRKTAAYAASGRKPVAIVNADFFLMGAGDVYDYEQGRPMGMEVENGMVIQKAMPGRELSVVFDDSGRPRSGAVGFSAVADGGGKSFPLTTVNHYADAGELTLFNNMANSCPTDSAWAWSPHNPSIMVSLSGPAGGWKVNERMEFTVTAIDPSVNTVVPMPVYDQTKWPFGGKDFNGEGAILVGNNTNFLPNETSLGLNTSNGSGNHITVTNQGSYYDLGTTGSDPYIYTTGLPGSVGNPGSITLTFEYQTSAAINDMQVFYGRPGAVGGVSTDANLQLQATGTLNAGNDSQWRTFTLDLKTAVTTHGWGAAGHTLRLDPGSVSGRQLLIRNIKINLTAGGGSGSATSRQFLESMTVGATVGIRMNVTVGGQPLPGTKPNICGTDRYILQSGQPTNNNWNEAHPRTGVGYSQDGKKAYLITVDGRQTNKSVGTTTRQLADIFRAAGASTAINLDGGGSTRMEVLGKLANSATENRRVANALMVVTSAPATGSPQLAVSPKILKTSPGASRQIIVNTRDENGNIIEYLPTGVRYTVKGDVGSIAGEGMFTAGSSFTGGYIVAQYGALKDSVQVVVRHPAGESNADLKNVELSAGALSPAFSPIVTSYKISFPELPTSLSITGTTDDPLATVEGNLTNATVTAGQQLSLTVTSENGKIKRYYFTIEPLPVTGTETLPTGSVRIYPNPLDGHKTLHIDLDREYSDVSVKICNAAGVPVYAGQQKGQYLLIPLDLSAGVYVLQLNLDRQIKTSKLVVSE